MREEKIEEEILFGAARIGIFGGWKRGDSLIVGRRSTKGLEKRAIATKAAQV